MVGYWIGLTASSPTLADEEDDDETSSSGESTSPAVGPVTGAVRRTKFDDEEAEDSDVSQPHCHSAASFRRACTASRISRDVHPQLLLDPDD